MINSSSPFYISLVDSSSGSNLGFIVNAGDVNSFIFSTYKAKYDEIKGKQQIEEKNYYARVGEGANVSKAFKFGSDWTPTFYAGTSCQVYVTIPKIPAAFNFIPKEGQGLRKDWWLKPSTGNLNFLNQFKIVKNTDNDFSPELTNNLKNTNTDDTNWDESVTGNTKFLSDSLYSGKIYIKLADINLTGESKPNGEQKRIVTNFFNSNIIAPTRYIRHGSLNLRNIRLFVDIYGLISSNVDTFSGLFSLNNWKVLDFFHERQYDNFRIPRLFDFDNPLSDIKNEAENIDVLVKQIFSKHYYDLFGGREDDVIINEGTLLKTPLVGRIILCYKPTLGDPLQIVVIREEITQINFLISQSNNSAGKFFPKVKEVKSFTQAQVANRVLGWDDTKFAKGGKLISITL